jgi:hypothetical protein
LTLAAVRRPWNWHCALNWPNSGLKLAGGACAYLNLPPGAAQQRLAARVTQSQLVLAPAGK